MFWCLCWLCSPLGPGGMDCVFGVVVWGVLLFVVLVAGCFFGDLGGVFGFLFFRGVVWWLFCMLFCG